ncbi:MAG: tetratricopeptide repeat protein, partial [Spirochaetales bacterium]|nr:tetratricopeptide repeat protein [Spirochaetales bacterium]
SLGFTRVTDKASPYASSHLDISKNDYIQYPIQTISYMSGDSDELGMVLASLFEGAAVKTALIPLANDFAVAVNLELSSKAVAGIFSDPEQLLLIGDDYYLPISINSISKGFNAAWKAASRQIKAEMEKGELSVVVLSDAWTSYPPLGMSGKKNIAKPSASALVARASRELDVFTAENLRPKIREYESKISSGKANDEDRIALGLLYVRSGDINSAAIVFKEMADNGNIQAMNNLANTYMLQKDLKSAKKWYENVLEKDKDNSVAKKGLERIANEK